MGWGVRRGVQSRTPSWDPRGVAQQRSALHAEVRILDDDGVVHPCNVHLGLSQPEGRTVDVPAPTT